MKILKNLVPYFFILIAVYGVIRPLLISGFFPVHDDTQVARVFEMGNALKDGFFPVRWVSDLGFGYGYPIFNFYAPLAYYIGAIFMLFGLTALTATKLMILTGVAASGFTMYLCAKSLFGKIGGIFAAVCYLYAPYHALDTYVRGDISEVFAYAFLPLAVFGLWKTFKTKNKKYFAISSLGFAGIVLSHNLTAFMVAPFFAAFALIFIFLEKKQSVYNRLLPLMSLIVGGILAGFYWIPVFLEMRHTNVLSQVGGGADFRNNFVCLQQLWYSQWGFGGSAIGCTDGIAFALGKIYIAIIVLSIITLPILLKKSKETGIIVSGILISLVISVFMLLQISEPIWNLITALSFLQYPWRFLLLSSFFISLLGAGLFFLLQKFIKQKTILVLFLLIACTLVIFLENRYFAPKYNFPATSEDFTSLPVLNWKTSNISSEYMPINFSKPQEQAQVPQRLIGQFSGKIIYLINRTNYKKMQVDSYENQTTLINLAYFPSWKAYVDKKQTKLLETSKGVKVFIPKGKHSLELEFKNTPAQSTGNIISVIGIVLIILAIIV